jgi:hypothetical protein
MALGDQFLRGRIAGIACLSTPFLVARRRLFASPFRELVVAGLGLAMFFENAAVRGIAAAYLAVIIYAWITGLAQRVLDSLIEPDLTGMNLLILRTPADEASAAFALSQIIGWISARLYALVPSAVRRAIVTKSIGSVAALTSMDCLT